MNPHKIAIILNGPPNSGKDYAVERLNISSSFTHLRFKDHLYRCTAALFNIDESTLIRLCTDRSLKEEPTCILKGFSPRGALIHVSEEVIKPNFGKEYFGEATAENMQPGINVISDCGFGEELGPIYRECEGNMLIMQISRIGCTFAGDSRSYINGFDQAAVTTIHNDSTDNFVKGMSVTIDRYVDYCKRSGANMHVEE